MLNISADVTGSQSRGVTASHVIKSSWGEFTYRVEGRGEEVMEETLPPDYNDASSTAPHNPFLLEYNPYVVPINGYIIPIVVLFTLVTNILVCAVLLSRNMRTATNTLLVAMALSDMLTGNDCTL